MSLLLSFKKKQIGNLKLFFVLSPREPILRVPIRITSTVQPVLIGNKYKSLDYEEISKIILYNHQS